MFSRHSRRCWATALSIVMATGCVPKQYQYSQFQDRASEPGQPAEVAIAYGKPNVLLDSLSFVTTLPIRIFRPRAVPRLHRLTPETTELLTTYLEKNDLEDVPVYVNRYNPIEQFRQLHRNKRVSPLLRYSFGTVTVAFQAVFPDRVWCFDIYNPYSHTLHLSNDNPALVIHRAALAKGARSRNYPGLAAVADLLPIASAWPRREAAGEVVAYAQQTGNWQLERLTYRFVYPETGMVVTGPVTLAFLTGVFWIPPAIVGNVTGYAMGKSAEKKRVGELQAAAQLAAARKTATSAAVVPVSHVEGDAAKAAVIPAAQSATPSATVKPIQPFHEAQR